jgi:hypothetical protein
MKLNKKFDLFLINVLLCLNLSDMVVGSGIYDQTDEEIAKLLKQGQ